MLAADHGWAAATVVDALVLFAPGLYTLPPAYSHRTNVRAPILVVSGSNDCGPNSLTKESLPLYQDVNSSVRALVVLKGANHCQWTTPTRAGVCSVAECHHLERTAQQAAGVELLQVATPQGPCLISCPVPTLLGICHRQWH